MEVEEKSVRLSTARSRELGAELRRVRRQSKIPVGTLIEKLGWSTGKLSKLETGTRGASVFDIATLLGMCAADKATRDRIMALAEESDTGNFLRLHDGSGDSLLTLALHERSARTITTYEALTVPSLLQTESYALTLTESVALTAARMDRQKELRGRRVEKATFFIHESALRLVVGTPRVTRDQLLHLTFAGLDPTCTVRVIPLAQGVNTSLCHPATLLTFGGTDRCMAYVETELGVVFHDAPEATGAYERKMGRLDTLALNAAQSRGLIAHYADLHGGSPGEVGRKEGHFSSS